MPTIEEVQAENKKLQNENTELKNNQNEKFKEMQFKQRMKKNWLLILLAVLLLGLVIGGGAFVFQIFDGEDKRSELLMGVYVVIAIVTLMTMLYIMAAGFKLMELQDKEQPLGLPEGSIRAMIALILIIVFIIFGIYLFRSVSDGVSTTLESGLSMEELQKVSATKYKNLQTRIEPKEITNTRRDEKDSTKVVEYKDTTYSIIAVQQASDEGSKMAQQLVTTVGTLVVSIASFYFGSTTVSSAVKAATSGGSSSGGSATGTGNPVGSGGGGAAGSASAAATTTKSKEEGEPEGNATDKGEKTEGGNGGDGGKGDIKDKQAGLPEKTTENTEPVEGNSKVAGKVMPVVNLTGAALKVNVIPENLK